MAPQPYDVIVVGGGPSGATAAQTLAEAGRAVLFVDPENRIKPCGGAIPTKAISEFDIPEEQLKAKVRGARIIAPSRYNVEMKIGDIGFVGMVDRDIFDPFLRDRAEAAGATRHRGALKEISQNPDGILSLLLSGEAGQPHITVRTKAVIGADGANSQVRRQMFGPDKKPPYVFAYHEIVKSPDNPNPEKFNPHRCDVLYDGEISPDFYGWVFPHGEHTSIGTGSAIKGHSLREATRKLREETGLGGAETVRTEGAPLPLRPMKRWDNGRNVLLTGDAAGTVAPSSGEGIYYAMLAGKLCAEAVEEMLVTGKAKALKTARKRFMKDHGRVFFILGLLQYFWYSTDKRREQFVKMCADPDVQRLTWESYLNKKLVRRDPLAHLRVFLKDVRQLLGLQAQ